MFEKIINYINVAGIVTNGFIISFTSQWANKNLTTTQNKLTCAVIFEVCLMQIFRFFIITE